MSPESVAQRHVYTSQKHPFDVFRSFCIALALLLNFTNWYRLDAQTTFQAGSLQFVNLNVPVSSNWKLSARIESRQYLYVDNGVDKTGKWDYERIQCMSVLLRQWRSGVSLGGGYLIRYQDQVFTHRLIQQMGYQSSPVSLFRHRLITDQSFRSSAGPLFRLRYRATLDQALSEAKEGRELTRLRLHSELLGILDAGAGDVEIWSGANLSIPLSHHVRLEPGVDHRLRGFLDDKTRHQVWFNVGITVQG